jgi:hypothetical protein
MNNKGLKGLPIFSKMNVFTQQLTSWRVDHGEKLSKSRHVINPRAAAQ